MASLKVLFEALVPENIKNIPLIQEAIDIFLKNLEEKSDVSLDIKKILEQVLTNQNAITRNSKLNLRKGVLKTYLYILYKTIKDIQIDQNIQEKLRKYNLINSSILNKSPEEILGIDYITTNKTFKESVGTLSSIKHAYEIASELESPQNKTQVDIKEIKPFHMVIQGGITAEIYDKFVNRLSHPLGFTYTYFQLLEDIFLDFFGLEKKYNINAIEVRGSKGSFDVFIENKSNNTIVNQNWKNYQTYIQSQTGYMINQQTIDLIWGDFQNRINPLTGKNFTIEEFQNQVIIWENKVVQNISETFTPDGKYTGVMFSDGTYLLQRPSLNISYETILVDYNTWVQNGSNNTDGVIKTFFSSNLKGHFSLFLDYTVDFVYTYKENFETAYTINITSINDSTGNAGNINYIDANGNQKPIDTSDFIIMTSPTYVQDVYIDTIQTNGSLYLTTNSANGAPQYYFTTSDVGGGFYLTAWP